jgi:hypothetical protein
MRVNVEGTMSSRRQEETHAATPLERVFGEGRLYGIAPAGDVAEDATVKARKTTMFRADNDVIRCAFECTLNLLASGTHNVDHYAKRYNQATVDRLFQKA